MANIKDAILKKKIGEVIYELMIKTTGDMVTLSDNKTIEEAVNKITQDIFNNTEAINTIIGTETSPGTIDNKISAALATAINSLTNVDDPTSLGGKIDIIEDALTVINDNDTGILATSRSYTDEKVGLSGTAYTSAKEYIDSIKDAIVASVTGAFHYKGAVDYIADLESIENPVNGDVYQVKYRGTEGTKALDAEYVYDGTTWVEFGSLVDLSDYYTSTQVTEAINNAVSTAIDTAADDASAKAETAKSEVIEAMSDRARIIVSETEPTDLTENDLWVQVIEDTEVVE